MSELETQLTADNERLRNENLRLQSRLDSTLAMIRRAHEDALSASCKALGVMAIRQKWLKTEN